jgi:lipopolysaccharide assembly outer membrane protein LptD (OstA)
MTHQPVRRSFVGIAAFGALLVTGGAVSQLALARQSPPSPSQAKKAMPPAPTGKVDKEIPLPGFGKSSGTTAGSAGVTPAGQTQASIQLELDAADLNNKSGIAKGTNLLYIDGDLRCTAMKAVYNKKTNEVDAQGNLQIDDPKHHVSGDRSHVERNKQMATMAGSVVITLKPTPPGPGVTPDSDSAKQRRFPVIITCDRAQDAYKKEFIVLTGHLVFKQNIRQEDGTIVERTLTAEHAEYDGKTNNMHLFQPVKAYDSQGQNIDFEKDVFVHTVENDETLTTSGRSVLHLKPQDVKDEDDASGKEKTPPPGGAPPR